VALAVTIFYYKVYKEFSGTPLSFLALAAY
jgi:hypothetical protein